LQGDFYAETLYADEARIKNVIYEQETNVDYFGKYVDVHKEDTNKRYFTIQLNPSHFIE
jgi:DNA-directed RNA polymerase subunit F